VLTTGTGYGGGASSVGSAREQAAVRAAAATITGLPVSQLSDATIDLLLGPLLRGSTTLVRGGS
jgi:hypothetical protein